MSECRREDRRPQSGPPPVPRARRRVCAWCDAVVEDGPEWDTTHVLCSHCAPTRGPAPEPSRRPSGNRAQRADDGGCRPKGETSVPED